MSEIEFTDDDVDSPVGAVSGHEQPPVLDDFEPLEEATLFDWPAFRKHFDAYYLIRNDPEANKWRDIDRPGLERWFTTSQCDPDFHVLARLNYYKRPGKYEAFSDHIFPTIPLDKRKRAYRLRFPAKVPAPTAPPRVFRPLFPPSRDSPSTPIVIPPMPPSHFPVDNVSDVSGSSGLVARAPIRSCASPTSSTGEDLPAPVRGPKLPPPTSKSRPVFRLESPPGSRSRTAPNPVSKVPRTGPFRGIQSRWEGVRMSPLSPFVTSPAKRPFKPPPAGSSANRPVTVDSSGRSWVYDDSENINMTAVATVLELQNPDFAMLSLDLKELLVAVFDRGRPTPVLLFVTPP